MFVEEAHPYAKSYRDHRYKYDRFQWPVVAVRHKSQIIFRWSPCAYPAFKQTTIAVPVWMLDLGPTASAYRSGPYSCASTSHLLAGNSARLSCSPWTKSGRPPAHDAPRPSKARLRTKSYAAAPIEWIGLSFSWSITIVARFEHKDAYRWR